LAKTVDFREIIPWMNLLTLFQIAWSARLDIFEGIMNKDRERNGVSLYRALWIFLVSFTQAKQGLNQPSEILRMFLFLREGFGFA
jgi:hypothetical protein